MPLGSVVRQEDQQGVVEFPGAVEVVEQAPGVDVDLVDHRGVDRHGPGLHLPLVGGQILPRYRPGRARRLGGCGQQPQFGHPLPALPVEVVVALVIAPRVLPDRRIRRLQGPVRRRKGQHREEGLPALFVLCQEL